MTYKLNKKNNKLIETLQLWWLQNRSKTTIEDPKRIQKMKQLKDLDFTGTEIKTIPEWIDKLPNLKYINATDTKITKLPTTIGNCKNLRRLDLARTKLTKLPKEFTQLLNLEVLDLKGTKLTNLPKGFTQLRNLEVLELSGSTIKSLPVDIWRLYSLRVLLLDGTRIKRIPQTPSDLRVLSIDESLLQSFVRSTVGEIEHLYVRISGSVEEFIKRQKKIYHNRNVNTGYKGYRFGNYAKKITVQSGYGPSTNYYSFTSDEWYQLMTNTFKRKEYRINKNTQFYNKSFLNARMKNVRPEKRAIINRNSYLKNNGTIRHVYKKKALNAYMTGKTTGRLHGGNFDKRNVKMLISAPKVTINKSAYIKNIKTRLSNVSLNKFTKEVKAIKEKLPGNISRNDVNAVVKSMKKYIMNKVLNRLNKTSPNDRSRLLLNFKNRGLINNNEIVALKNKFTPKTNMRNKISKALQARGL